MLYIDYIHPILSRMDADLSPRRILSLSKMLFMLCSFYSLKHSSGLHIHNNSSIVDSCKSTTPFDTYLTTAPTTTKSLRQLLWEDYNRRLITYNPRNTVSSHPRFVPFGEILKDDFKFYFGREWEPTPTTPTPPIELDSHAANIPMFSSNASNNSIFSYFRSVLQSYSDAHDE
jgi:hypothetical protein